MYGLLFLLLGAIGLNAGWIASMSYAIGAHTRFDACMADAGTLWPAPDLAGTEATRRELGACLRPITQPWALIMLAGALTAFALTALLAVAGAARMRRLLRAAGRASGPAADAATARFADLCWEQGASGTRRPQIHILRPGARFTQPFTTAGAGRPVVVIPAAVACAGPDVLDAVVRHELAHVRSRDVWLAAGAWWSGWTGVLLPAVCAAPLLDPRRATAPGYGAGLLVAAVLGGLLLALRAHMLRLRELVADQAAAVPPAQPGAFAQLLRAGQRPAGRLRSLLAVHPDTATRIRALSTGTAGTDGGFLPSAVTALVSIIAVQPVYQVFLHWVGWAGPSSRPLFAVAGGLVAVLLIPVWARRYAADPRAPWWPPVLGVALGGAAGFFLPGPGLPVSPGGRALSMNWITGPLLVLALGGTAVLLVALAYGVQPDRRGQLLAATVAGMGVAAVTMPAAVQVVIEWSSGMLPPTFLRLAMFYGAALWDAEPAVAFVAVAALAVVAARSAPHPRPAPRPVFSLLVAVVVTAAAAGVLITLVRQSPDGDPVADLPLLWHRWWVSALAGVVALTVLLTRAPAGRTTTLRLAGAMTAAAAVTLAAAVAQFAARTVATGWDDDYQPWLLGQYVTVPLRLLLLMSAVVAPVALLAARPVRRRPGRWSTPLAAAVTGLVCAAVMFGAGEILTGGVADARSLAAKAQPAPSTTASTAPPTPTALSGVLTPAQARHAVDAAGAVLPGWTTNPSLTGGGDDKSACAAALVTPPTAEPDVEAARGFSATPESQPPTGAHIVVTVESYRQTPRPEAVFAPLRQEIDACGSYTEPNPESSDGRSHMRLSVREPGSTGYPAFAYGLVRTDKGARGLSAVTTVHAVIVVVGHQVVSVGTILPFIGEPPERRLAALDATAARVLAEVIHNLGG
ncbi:hypothetical protein GCM10020358_72030 [Amorphoplanes nipponensis]|uniref:Peptidase M48 domain-containing protein n=2 Tax=Actinoplanes nipponensis TaxID=135950 RepID=A0A919JAA4_9ACTN|nr:hypothetical protein Ani05nite_05420 [Actinoplanes nipponensis]